MRRYHLVIFDKPVHRLSAVASQLRTLKMRGYDLAIVSDGPVGSLHSAVTRDRLGWCFLRVEANVLDREETYTSIMDQAGVVAHEVAVLVDDVHGDAARAAAGVGAVPFVCSPDQLLTRFP